VNRATVFAKISINVRSSNIFLVATTTAIAKIEDVMAVSFLSLILWCGIPVSGGSYTAELVSRISSLWIDVNTILTITP
jgi:hypothetical protein